MYIYVNIHICVNIHKCVYVYIYTHIYIYIYLSGGVMVVVTLVTFRTKANNPKLDSTAFTVRRNTSHHLSILE